jgi:tetratricopeptide (TPR) repeat protein
MAFVADRKEEYRQRRDRLLAVARAVDPDPAFRDKIRNPHVWDDRRQLEELAQRAPQTDLSPRLAALLAELVRSAKGDPERLLRTFQARYPDDFWLNFDLAKRLDISRPAEALRYYQAALAVGPRNFIVYCHMGYNLLDRCYWDEAAAILQQALARVPEDDSRSAALRNSLGEVVSTKGDMEGAMKLFRDSVRIAPRQAGVYLNLGGGLKQMGRFREALEAFRQGQRLAVETGSRFREDAEQLVRQGERLLELDRRLESSKPEPASAEEALEFAEVCYYKKRYADAVAFYRRAFKQAPKSAGSSNGGPHYQATCAAILAAGATDASPHLDAPRRTALRKQASTWLRDDLNDWTQRAQDPKAQPTVEAALRLWKRHPSLAGLRDPAAVGQLPDDEQQACKQFWADVDALLSKVQAN